MRKKYRKRIETLESNYAKLLHSVDILKKSEKSRDLKLINQKNLYDKKKLIGKEVDTFISLGCLGMSISRGLIK